MKLKDLLEIINNELEIELYLGDRIGVFKKGDRGLKSFLENEINELGVDGKRLIVCLD